MGSQGFDDGPFDSVPPMTIVSGLFRVNDIGFTGTRKGMTDAQKHCVYHLIHEIRPDFARHGDCTGADADFHQLVREHSPVVQIIGYPPINPKNRAWCDFDTLMPEGEYHDRDKKIVHDSQLLIACPDGTSEVLRSGTWTTIRYARKIERAVKIVWPDGSLTEENQ